jgi:hypothetical protein
MDLGRGDRVRGDGAGSGALAGVSPKRCGRLEGRRLPTDAQDAILPHERVRSWQTLTLV